jgi:hypothetical protein
LKYKVKLNFRLMQENFKKNSNKPALCKEVKVE